jgi:3-phosphoglycerate kinase
MKYISDVPAAELKGKRVLVRAGLDVPLDKNGNVADIFRIKAAVKTLKFLAASGARTIVLSHIGRKPEETNEPVARALKTELPMVYIADLLGSAAKQAVAVMKDGEVLLLENLRRDEREANNDDGFARELATLGDIYVDDAFSVAHRAHASIVGIPKYLPSYAGILMHDEIEILIRARNPEHPSFAILGGAKFETKSPLIKVLLESYDHLFVTGALANDVFKAKGFPVGASLISKELPTPEILNNPHFVSPIDVTVEQSDKQASVRKPEAVAINDKIVDIGPDTVAEIAPYIAAAKFILWNGPTGLYEDGFISYTHAIADLISKSGAHAVIGGGDTIAVIEESGVTFGPNVFLSTGGGAMLEFLLDGTLPGIEALC